MPTANRTSANPNCNDNGLPDLMDLDAGALAICDSNGVPTNATPIATATAARMHAT